MHQMQEPLCSPFGEMWLKFVSVKQNCKNFKSHFCFFCAHICKYAHVHIEKSTSVYLKKICI